MTEREEILKYGLTFPDSYVDTPFKDENWVLLRYRKNKHAFAWTFEREGHIWVNVKASPQWLDFWRNLYSSVVPAYHLSKQHWNSIILDGTVPDDDIRKMISESYQLVIKSPK
ncbi:MAG: MmcQ/YjbR family DNA-binding protein [Ruminococcus sp.]|jgi:predicted DNA-binding protein (MmcQ/YjbR family)|nr:MmcQ/YjbR family DNA-binding protein [Ruminococcus sp.]